METSPHLAFSGPDQMPLGRPFGMTDAKPQSPTERRPFGLRLAVAPRHVIPLNLEALRYDPVRQIGLVEGVNGEVIPLMRHTDGQTNTQTNADGHGGNDSDTDHRED